MKENHMTTIMVHNMLNSQRPLKSIFADSPILNVVMNYELDTSFGTTIQMRDQFRSRSFYQQRNRFFQNFKGINKGKVIKKLTTKDEHSVSEPKIIDLEFESFSRSKPKRQGQRSNMSTHQYYSIMVDSMQQYIKKVQKGKRKKIQKCEKIRNYGVNIQSIKIPQQANLNLQLITEKFQRVQRVKKDYSVKKASNQVLLKQKTLQKHNNANLSKSLMGEKNGKDMCKTVSTASYTHKTKFLTKKIIAKTEKKEEDRKIGSKFNRMFNHFHIILSSFGVAIKKEDQIEAGPEFKLKKLDRKYAYYVGKGNNKNLIVSILKKRWWWVEAQQISSANFIWTQLKNTLILQKQSSMMYSDLEEVQPSLYVQNKSLLTQQQDREQNIEPIYNIFHEKHSKSFHIKLSKNQQKKFLRKMKVPNVLHNHYEANYMLGNKKALFYNMTEYKNYKKQNAFEYIPLTFHIQKINSPAFKQFEKKAKEEKKSLWIVKPGQNSNRGQGIFVSDSIQSIKNRIQKNKKHTFIIQKYIKNNFTFNRRKFDIRTYLLMVSIGGVQKFYWYAEGYLRTSSQIYTLTDLDDLFIHLTNDAVQSTSDNYGKFQKGNKVTYSEFQRYLDINYPNQKYSVSILVSKMKRIAKQVVQATYFKIDPCRKQYSLQLFGMDFLVDGSFKPWLLQVNTNPCLQLSSPVLQRLIPRMIQNLFRIAIDPVFQPQQNEFPRNLACYIPDNIIQSNRFELIFDSLHDRNHDWEAYSVDQNSNKVYEDQDQQFENDGQIIKIED